MPAASSPALPCDVKVSLIGLADSGKTSLVKFLKGANYSSGDNMGEPTSNDSWGISVNIIEWDYDNE